MAGSRPPSRHQSACDQGQSSLGSFFWVPAWGSCPRFPEESRTRSDLANQILGTTANRVYEENRGMDGELPISAITVCTLRIKKRRDWFRRSL